MKFHIFRCSAGRSVYGVTDEPTGAKLPPAACARGKWVAHKTLTKSAIAFSAVEAEAAIKKDGYYIVRVQVQVHTP